MFISCNNTCFSEIVIQERHPVRSRQIQYFILLNADKLQQGRPIVVKSSTDCLRISKAVTEFTMSLSDIFAEPMLDTEEYLQEYIEQLIDLDKKGLLPRLDATLTYKVYTIRGSDFGAHKSIVLTTNDEHFITVELGFIEVDGKKHIYPVTRQLGASDKSKMEYLGAIKAKGEDLIGKAVAVMKQFGSYFKFCKNCQDFCNMYAEAIGLKNAQTLTDHDKVAITGILAAIVAFLFARLR